MYICTRRRRLQLSIDISCRRPRSAANPPHAAAVIDRRDRQTDRRTDGRADGRTDRLRDRQTDRQTDGRTLDRFMSLTAYYADRVTAARIMCTGT